MSEGYCKKTIADIVEEVDSKKILLPAIQRKYVWKEGQITRLMDSIMKGYPFGTFLLWKVKKKTLVEKQYSMYEFIKDFHERDRYCNIKAGYPNITNLDETVSAALDGQQRLTSLYIALKGTIAYKLPKKRWNNDDSFPTKELYFNLLSQKVDDEDDISYVFKFLTPEEAQESSENELWYKVKEILQYPDVTALTHLILSKGWTNPIITGNVAKLFQQIKSDKLINYFEVETESIDDVLDIFVRVNQGGTVLSKSDLLFSTIVSYWDNGREEIDALLSAVNRIGEHYSFSNDFIMRTALYVMDMPISLKVETFGKDNVNRIKTNWKSIKEAIKNTVELLNELGLTSENIVADNAVVPIIYYRYKYGSAAFEDEQTKLEIRKFLVISQIKHIFGQSTNVTLTALRNELQKHNDKFKLSYLQDLRFVGDSNLKYTEDDISEWFDCYEKNAFTFMLLSLLYPHLKYAQKGFHQDHMHPYSAFEKKNTLLSLSLPDGSPITDEKIKLWQHQRNTLANLQLLEGRENESKNDEPLADWLNVPANKSNAEYLPSNIDYSLNNFDEFLEKRKELMLEELKKILL